MVKVYWVNYTARNEFGKVITTGSIIGQSEKLNVQCMNNWMGAIWKSVCEKFGTTHQMIFGGAAHQRVNVTIDAVIPLPDEEAK